jgi:hypothetical protein
MWPGYLTCAAKKSSVVLILLTDGVTRVFIYELLFAYEHMHRSSYSRKGGCASKLNLSLLSAIISIIQ